MVASSHTSNSEDRECPICNELYGERERAKKLVCGHSFGSRCIRQWLRNHETCPTCRANVLRDASHPVFSGSHASVEWTTPPVVEEAPTRQVLEENTSRRPKPLRALSIRPPISRGSKFHLTEAMIPVIEENYSPPPSPDSPTRNSGTRYTDRDRLIKYPKEDLEGRKPVIETRPSRSSSTRHHEPETGIFRPHDRSQINRSNTVHSSRHRQHEHTDASRSSRTRQPPVRFATLYPPRRPSRTAATVRQEEGEQSLRAHDVSGRRTSRSSRAQPHARSSTVRNSRVEESLQGQVVPEEHSPHAEN